MVSLGPRYDGAVNVSEWAVELLREHAAVLSRRQVAGAEILIETGEGWLAAYDLYAAGLEDGWLTADNYRTAEKFGRDRAFSKFSDTVERTARERLRS